MPGVRIFWSVQYLRAFAAAGVVLAHAGDRIAADHGAVGNQLFNNGQAGVDVFFVISGFIIYLVGTEPGTRPASFLARRVGRVVPIYWFYTAIYILGFVVVPRAYREMALDPGHILKSFLFIPAFQPVTHQIVPVIPAGWTLDYEMLFYAVFAVALAASAPPLRTIAALFGALVLLGAVDPGVSAVRIAYTDPILFEFVAGCMIAALLRGGRRPPPAVSWALLAAAAVGFVATARFPEAARVVRWGIPAACLVSGAVFVEASHGLPRIGFLKTCGDASYSLYLSHLFTNGMAAYLLSRAGLGWLPDVLYVAVVFTLAQVVALATWRWIERPSTAHASALLLRLAAAPSTSVGRAKSQPPIH